jgi:peptidoglycan/xylan/chitin deacetylase (PgdA/CDA1 family)
MLRLAGSRLLHRRSVLAALPAAFLLSSSPGRTAEPPATPRRMGDVRVPILLYHRFGPVLTDEMTVTTPVFEAQLREIAQRGYRVAPLRALLAALGEANAPALERSVVLTVDDGHRTVYSDLFPLVQRFRIPVTLFIYPTAISNADYAMTWAQLAEMKASGLVDVQSHTFWHPNFNIERKRLSPQAYQQFVHDQLTRSKTILEQRVGGTVDLLAWPFGIYDEELMQAARAAGYTAAFSIERRPVTAAEKIMALPRYIVVDADRGGRFDTLMAGQR